MFNSEKAFDMLPSIVDLYDKLDLDGYRKKIAEEHKGKKDVNNKALGIDLFKYILKNSGRIKEEVFEIVAIVEEKSIKEVKAQSFIETINTIKEIFSDEETTDFFSAAMQSDTPEA